MKSISSTGSLPKSRRKRSKGTVMIRLHKLKRLEWSNEEVLRSSFDRNMRSKNVEHAIFMGQFYARKVIVIFRDKQNVTYRFFGQIRFMNDGKLVLTKEIYIPVNRVVRIRFVRAVA